MRFANLRAISFSREVYKAVITNLCRYCLDSFRTA